MSLRRSSRRSSSGGGGIATAAGRGFVIGDVMVANIGGRDARADVSSRGDIVDEPRDEPKNGSTAVTCQMPISSARLKRLFVGDSVEQFCSQHANQSEEVPNGMHSPIEDAEEATAATALAPSSFRTAASSDSIVSSSSSSDDSERPKRKMCSLQSSSSSSLASKTIAEELPKKKARPLFKRKLKLNLNVVRKGNSAESKTTLARTTAEHFNINSNADDENIKHSRCQKRPKSKECQISIQRLLSLASQRTQQAQANLTLAQLKRQARLKAQENSESTRRSQRKRSKKKGKRKRKPRSPAPGGNNGEGEETPPEPMEVVEMATGVLYLYRGENPRAKFVRKK